MGCNQSSVVGTVTSKRAVAVRFLVAMTEYRARVKAETVAAIQRIPLEVLADEQRLRDWLLQLTEEVSRKYLVTEKGRLPADLARAIMAYAEGMGKRDGES